MRCAAYEDILKSELNIKAVELCTLDEAAEHGLRIINELRVNARVAGKRLRKDVQFAIKSSKSGAWHVDAAGAPVVEIPSGEIALEEGEYELINRVEEANPSDADSIVSAALPTGGFVILDTTLDDDLIAEGYARDAIRSVQDARKEAGLDIADRIVLKLTVPAADAPEGRTVPRPDRRRDPGHHAGDHGQRYRRRPRHRGRQGLTQDRAHRRLNRLLNAGYRPGKSPKSSGTFPYPHWWEILSLNWSTTEPVIWI